MELKLTKFGISAALLSAICYFAGYTSFVTVALLLMFALMSDLDYSLKKNAAQAVIVAVIFSIAIRCFSALSTSYLDACNTIFIEWFDLAKVYKVMIKLNLCSLLTSLLRLADFIVMIYASITALKGGVVKLPVITKLVEKHFGNIEDASVIDSEE